MKRVVAIIVAGGGGKRMGGDLPKQFLPLGGRPLLDRTLSAFTSSARVDGVILALPPAFPDGAKESYRSVPKVLAVVDGGSQRQDSVRNSLAVVPAEAEVILVHDAVRPVVSEGLLGRCVELAREHGAVVPVVPVRSTVKQWDREEKTLCTRDRSDLMLAQTPQGFRAGILRDARRRGGGARARAGARPPGPLRRRRSPPRDCGRDLRRPRGSGHRPSFSPGRSGNGGYLQPQHHRPRARQDGGEGGRAGGPQRRHRD